MTRRIAAAAALVLGLMLCLGAPVLAADAPNDNEQEILVKATLMTFNDANLTGNYTILHAKAAKPFRDQISPEKLADSFKAFRDKKVNLASIVADDIDSAKDPKIDSDGVLHLQGRFKDDDKKIRYDLKFLHEAGAWKLVGINVKYKED